MCRGGIVRLCQDLLPFVTETDGQLSPDNKTAPVAGKIVSKSPEAITGGGSNFSKVAERPERAPGTGLAEDVVAPGQEAATFETTSTISSPRRPVLRSSGIESLQHTS
jgi:hypothetical protein